MQESQSSKFQARSLRAPNQTKAKSQRRGAALVEFAVCLPVVMILILGSIEATNAIFLKQALTTAAYEGIREAVRSDSDRTLAVARVNEILNSRNVRNATVRFTPNNVENVKRGRLIQVEISAPLGKNSPFIGRVITDRRCTTQATMVKE